MIKGIFDFISSLIILTLLLPFSILISIILLFYFKAPPVIIQERSITKERKIFKLLKFRTINLDSAISPKAFDNILFKHELSIHVNKFCRWLRTTGLDEIPQLINIIKGEMSLVGPRPFVMSDLEILHNKFPEIELKRKVIKSKPGVTGLWQVYGDRRLGLNNLIELDLQYEQQKSFWLDIKIIMKTIPLIFQAKHDDSIVLRPLIMKGLKKSKY